MTGRPTYGALVLHGFTSTPASVAPLADGLRDAGFEVESPLLPGHGTRWEDLAGTSAEQIWDAVTAAHDRLAQRCRTVVPVGMSMGGALALWTAAQQSSPGAVLINPGLRLTPGTRWAARALAPMKPTLAPVAGDIAAPGVVEEAYPVTPVRAVVQLDRIFAAARQSTKRLKRADTPILLLRSPIDAVVGSGSSRWLKGALDHQVREVILRRSRHVATLDLDADLLLRRSIGFLHEVTEPAVN